MLFISKKRFRYLILIVITIVLLLSVNKYSDKLGRYFYPLKYYEYVLKYSSEYNIDPLLTMSIIRVESNFNEKAKSSKGAKGLMQITDSTAQWIAKSMKLNDHSPEKLYNPEYNIKLGCWYLNNLITQFQGNVTLALTAYNGGSGNVEKWLKDTQYSVNGSSLNKIPFEETDTYVKRIKKDYYIYKRLYER